MSSTTQQKYAQTYKNMPKYANGMQMTISKKERIDKKVSSCQVFALWNFIELWNKKYANMQKYAEICTNMHKRRANHGLAIDFRPDSGELIGSHADGAPVAAADAGRGRRRRRRGRGRRWRRTAPLGRRRRRRRFGAVLHGHRHQYDHQDQGETKRKKQTKMTHFTTIDSFWNSVIKN